MPSGDTPDVLLPKVGMAAGRRKLAKHIDTRARQEKGSNNGQQG